MGEYKRIERCIGSYIAARYRNVVEVGIGENHIAASIIHKAGIPVICTDIIQPTLTLPFRFAADDIFSPQKKLYTGADCIYSIRPAEEMVPPMIGLAREIGCDLLVYHLGFECYGNGGEIIDCGVLLHRYHHAEKPSKSVD